ncbi:MAG: SPOR domain-containing protein, partial [Rikenellaceae bacterium]|nr:SPOR domain-containing protein [Rikenellaceae bacterium]
VTRLTSGNYEVYPQPKLIRLLQPLGRQSLEIPVIDPSVRKTEARKIPESGNRTAPAAERKIRHLRTVWGWLAAGCGVVLLGTGYWAFGHRWFGPGSNGAHPLEILPETPPAGTPASELSSAGGPDSEILPAADPRENASEAGATETATALEIGGDRKGVLPEDHTGEVYHIITGVFSTRENAERFVRENRFEPEKTTIIPTVNGQFMVSVGRYADKTSADTANSRWQQSQPQAWVSKRRR